MTTAELNRAAPASLSLTAGGPLFRIEQRLSLEASPVRLIVVLVSVTWGVAVILGVAKLLLDPAAENLLLKLGGHARLLVGIPVLVLAEKLLETRVADATETLVSRGVLAPGSVPAWRQIAQRVERVRDARTPEIVIALAVAGMTIAGVAGELPAVTLRWLAPVLHGAPDWSSPVWWWFVAVGEPLFLFLLLRWVWRWLLWAFVLARLSRLQLHVQPSHPDRLGGLAFLQESVDALMLVVFVTAVALAGSWADEIVATGAKAATFAPYFLAQIVVSVVFGVAPFLVFTTMLFREQRAVAMSYSLLARAYVGEFDAKWTRGHPPADRLLGNADIQSLADLGTAIATIEEMRFSPVSMQRALRIVLIAVAPIVPLLLYWMPATEIARRVIERGIGSLE